MSAPLYRYEGEGAFTALPRFRAELDAEFVVGAMYSLDLRQDRSPKSHAHFFAKLTDAYGSLPDHVSRRWPSDIHFRKWLLIKAGWCTMHQHPCQSRAEAERSRQLAERMDDYAVVVRDDCLVTVYTAKSQAKTAMDRRAFQEVKDKIFGMLDDMLGAERGAVERHAAEAA